MFDSCINLHSPIVFSSVAFLVTFNGSFSGRLSHLLHERRQDLFAKSHLQDTPPFPPSQRIKTFLQCFDLARDAEDISNY